MEKTRELWVDSVKIFTCVLVVIGHFVQSMVGAGIMADSAAYQWFGKTIYYFYVPLFFICSGYLFQKGTPVNSVVSWKSNVLKKLLELGVPYFVFSLATWLLKTAVTSPSNSQADSLTEYLFVRPAPPYLYLCTLFIMFLITPTLFNRKVAILAFFVAMIGKWVTISGRNCGIYVIDALLQYEIWFVFGMFVKYLNIPKEIRKQKNIKIAGIALAMLVVVGNIAAFKRRIQFSLMGFLFGILASYAVLFVFISTHYADKKQRVVKWLAQYTRPIFLMCTIFAAGFQGVLMKIGVENPVIHIIGGLVISFAGPIIAAEIMKLLKLDVLIWPGRCIRLSGGKDR